MADIGLPFEALATYLVICGGVDSKRGVRVSTHGAKSVSDRTGIPYRAAQRNLDSLQEYGFLITADEGNMQGGNPAASRWLVAGPEPDTQLCQSFLNRPANKTRSPLTRINAEVRHAGKFTSGQAKIDTLLLFVWLHRDYDLGAFGGIHPQVWHQTFAHVPTFYDAEDGDSGELYVSTGESDDVLVTVAQPSIPVIAIEKAGEILPINDEQTELSGLRLSYAFRCLLDLRLAYKAVVVWHSDPVRHVFDEPVVTLHINDAWGRENEASAQGEINRLVWRKKFIPVEYDFDTDGSFSAGRNERYRYVIDADIAADTVVLRQLRLRHWAATEAVVLGRAMEQDRTTGFVNARIRHE